MHAICNIKRQRWSDAPYLYSKNAKDDEESTADEDNVANGFQRGDEGLHHQLQTRSSAYHPEGRTEFREGEAKRHIHVHWKGL